MAELFRRRGNRMATMATGGYQHKGEDSKPRVDIGFDPGAYDSADEDNHRKGKTIKVKELPITAPMILDILLGSNPLPDLDPSKRNTSQDELIRLKTVEEELMTACDSGDVVDVMKKAIEFTLLVLELESFVKSLSKNVKKTRQIENVKIKEEPVDVDDNVNVELSGKSTSSIFNQDANVKQEEEGTTGLSQSTENITLNYLPTEEEEPENMVIVPDGDYYSDSYNDNDSSPSPSGEYGTSVMIRNKMTVILNCPYCNKIFRAVGKQLEHMRTHTGEKPFICEMCGSAFSQKGSYRRHLRLIHKRGQPGQEEQVEEIRTVTSNVQKPAQAPKYFPASASAGSMFTSTSTSATSTVRQLLELQQKPRRGRPPKHQHHRITLQGYNDFPRFTSSPTPPKLTSILDVERKRGQEAKNNCVLPEPDANFGVFEKHDYYDTLEDNDEDGGLVIDEDKEILQECQRLEYQKPNSYSPSKSGSSPSQSKVYRFQCPFCLRKFYQSTHFKDHVKTHTGERPHLCPVNGCGSRFIQRTNLRMHLRKKHQTDEATARALAREMKTEKIEYSHWFSSEDSSNSFGVDDEQVQDNKKGGKKFTCGFPGCDKTFERQPILILHMRSHEYDEV